LEKLMFQPKNDKKEIRKAILATCRLEGCTCNPDISITAEAGAIKSVAVAHDDWCKHRKDTPEEIQKAEFVEAVIRDMGTKHKV
jgi:hypothetical protein